MSAFAIAQTPFKVDEADAQQHLLKHVDPEYPAIAKVAQIQGEVVLQLDIGTDGRVINVTPLSGPPMLLQAAADAARQWQYKPFEENGSPVSATLKAQVLFTLGISIAPKDEQVAQIFFPLSTKCTQLVSQRADPSEEANACQKAAEQAGPVFYNVALPRAQISLRVLCDCLDQRQAAKGGCRLRRKGNSRRIAGAR